MAALQIHTAEHEMRLVDPEPTWIHQLASVHPELSIEGLLSLFSMARQSSSSEGTTLEEGEGEERQGGGGGDGPRALSG